MIETTRREIVRATVTETPRIEEAHTLNGATVRMKVVRKETEVQSREVPPRILGMLGLSRKVAL